MCAIVILNCGQTWLCANVFPPLKQYIFLLTDMIFPVLCCLLEMALEVYKGIHTKTAVNVMFVTFATCVCHWGPCCWSFLVFYVVFLVVFLCCLHSFCVLFPILPSVYWMSLRVLSEVYVLLHSVTSAIPSQSRANLLLSIQLCNKICDLHKLSRWNYSIKLQVSQNNYL